MNRNYRESFDSEDFIKENTVNSSRSKRREEDLWTEDKSENYSSQRKKSSKKNYTDSPDELFPAEAPPRPEIIVQHPVRNVESVEPDYEEENYENNSSASIWIIVLIILLLVAGGVYFLFKNFLSTDETKLSAENVVIATMKPEINEEAEEYIYPEDTTDWETVPEEEIVSYSVICYAESGGRVSPGGVSSVAEGDSLEVFIRADDGFTIDSVYVDGINMGALESYTFASVYGDHVLEAVFAEIVQEPEPVVEPEETEEPVTEEPVASEEPAEEIDTDTTDDSLFDIIE